MTRRVVALAALVVAAVGAAGAGAGAIETSTFGIAPAVAVAGAEHGGHLRLGMRPGETATTRLRVWNKTDRPLTLALGVMPASVKADGTPSLGGDRTPVGWVRVTDAPVRLAGREARVVDVRVHAPDPLPAGIHTVAVLAQVQGAGAAPAVLERVGVVMELARAPGAPSRAVSVAGVPLWLAVLALAFLGGAAGMLVRHRRRISARGTPRLPRHPAHRAGRVVVGRAGA